MVHYQRQLNVHSSFQSGLRFINQFAELNESLQRSWCCGTRERVSETRLRPRRSTQTSDRHTCTAPRHSDRWWSYCYFLAVDRMLSELYNVSPQLCKPPANSLLKRYFAEWCERLQHHLVPYVLGPASHRLALSGGRSVQLMQSFCGQDKNAAGHRNFPHIHVRSMNSQHNQ